MKQDWIDNNTPLCEYYVFRVNSLYCSELLAYVWYPAHLEPTDETVRKDLILCGWFADIEVVQKMDKPQNLTAKRSLKC